jgi:hypothetical protein
MSLNGTATPPPNGNGNGQAAAANLAYTKFLFVTPRRLDDAAGTRLRTAGGLIARGFFNDFDVDGSPSGTSAPRDAQVFDTIQFLTQDGDLPEPPPDFCSPWLPGARYVVQVSSKYRPRLEDIQEELKRRLGDAAEVHALDGAVRTPRYSSAEMQHYMTRNAAPRRSGRVSRNAIIVPIRKRADWWQQSTLERHAYFYPHVDYSSGCAVQGHAQAAEHGIPVLYRRLYHNPDGYHRDGEYDFLTYFECADDALPVFEQVCTALRDTTRNPEWRFVEEGPVWRGRRVLRW